MSYIIKEITNENIIENNAINKVENLNNNLIFNIIIINSDNIINVIPKLKIETTIYIDCNLSPIITLKKVIEGMDKYTLRQIIIN